MSHSAALSYLLESFDITKLQPLVVDIGAADGRYTSNSYPLIMDHGWHGVLIEPQIQQLDRARAYHADHLDRVTFFPSAVCEQDSIATLFLHPNDGDGMTTCNHGSSLLPIPGSRVQTTISTMSYDSLVDVVDFDTVGLLSIDAEGYDMEILRGIFEATKSRPQVIISETDYFLRSPQRDERIAFLTDYECIYNNEDQIFVHKTLQQ
jgi:FkbM family methyltransferase